MNNQGGGVGYGGGGFHPPGPYGPPQGQLYDAYGQPVQGYYGGGDGYNNGQYNGGMGQTQQQGQFYPNDPSMAGGMQGQQMGGMPQSSPPELVPRDPRRPPQLMQQLQQQQQQQASTSGYQQQMQANNNMFIPSENSTAQPERIPRNPHPHVPLHGLRHEPEPYDPSLPTYNATPVYPPIHQPQQVISGPKIIAPSLSSIFQAAADQLSKRNGGKADGSVNFAPSKQVTAMQQEPKANIEVITGKVTQMQGNVGMVSGEIFFQTNVVVGPMPQVGDKVVVEAEAVSGMPFKFNGKRVQVLSKDLTGEKEKERGSSRTPKKDKEKDKHRDRDRDKDRDRDRKERRKSSTDNSAPNFGPLPTMPHSLNLLQSAPSSSVPGQLKSILKRNPPPPPIISKHKMETEKYQPEMSPIPTPVPPPSSFAHTSSLSQFRSNEERDRLSEHFINKFKSGSFSLDLRNEFPVITQPSELEQLYPEIVYVNTNSSSSRRRSPSPKRGDRRRSSSPGGKRRRSPSPRRRRSPSPKRRSPSPKRRSSPRRRSRSPVRRQQRRSVTPISSRRRSSERGRRSPSASLLETENNESKRIADAWNSEPDIIMLEDSPDYNKRHSSSSSRNDRSDRRERVVKEGDRGIVVTRGSSILPKIVPNPEYEMQQSKKGGPPNGPIKFAIGSGPQTQPKLVPNPSYSLPQQQQPRSVPKPMQASKHLTKPVIPPNATPKDIVATIEKELKKNKKKKKEEQEPAFKIVSKEKPQQITPLSDEQKLHMWEEERQLMKQKQTLNEITQRDKKGPPVHTPKHLLELKYTVENKLKQLREKFDEDAKLKKNLISNDPQSTEEVERIKNQIALAKFEEEERRLKSIGDREGLELLWKAEDRRQRIITEERLDRIRNLEVQLKKEKNWTELKKLREEHGGTAEREMELIRLRELRKRDEALEEEDNNRVRAEEERIRWMQEEEEIHRRELERLQRGDEGPVRRTVMDTHDRQLSALGIQVGQGQSRGTRESRSDSPRRLRDRTRSPRRRSRSRSRDLRRSRSRDRVRINRRSRSRSEERHRRSGRRRSRSSTPPRRRSPSPFIPRDRRRSISPEVAFIGHRSPSPGLEEQRRIEEQMELMNRQEEELQRRERELYQRMQMVERGYLPGPGPPMDYHPEDFESDPDFHRYEQRY